jgi:hypothetical protein
MGRILGIIIPIIIAVLTLYFTKPSADKCTREAIEKLTAKGIKSTASNIYLKDHLIARSIKYVAAGDTSSLGYGALFYVKIRDNRLEEISANK